MSNGERIIVKLDPDYNPTGKPMPDTLLKQIKADPDFTKLTEAEQKKVISKVENMIKDVEDVTEYGTLKEKLIKVAALKNHYENKNGLPFIIVSNNLSMGLLEVPYEAESQASRRFSHISNPHRSDKMMFLKEGSYVNEGQCILNLIAINATPGGSYTQYSDYKVAEITAPISGLIFSLTAIQTDLKPAKWNDDLFIVSSIPGDTREEAIKWYKETTGKTPTFKTNYDKKREADEENKNVDDYLSKWDL